MHSRVRQTVAESTRRATSDAPGTDAFWPFVGVLSRRPLRVPVLAASEEQGRSPRRTDPTITLPAASSGQCDSGLSRHEVWLRTVTPTTSDADPPPRPARCAVSSAWPPPPSSCPRRCRPADKGAVRPPNCATDHTSSETSSGAPADGRDRETCRFRRWWERMREGQVGVIWPARDAARMHRITRRRWALRVTGHACCSRNARLATRSCVSKPSEKRA
jgi:hypothetical protein